MLANPAMELNAYSAPLGMRFSYGTAFGERFTGGIFIAEHGAGQVMQRTGCRISFIKIVEGRAAGYEVFASGWLTGERAWGRPADVQVGPDGALYVSDDLAGVIYRIYYEKK